MKRYLGQIVREMCPGLYGKPIYDSKGRFIQYTIIIPKFKKIKAKELSEEK